MSKAVLISIKPQWCELIASGEKIVEVRKTRPKRETPFKCYIYCTKGRGDCLWRWNGIWYDTQDPNHRPNRLDGKVIGEFVCDQIDEIGYSPEMHGEYISDIDDIHYVSCVDFEQMFDYLADGYGYGWHISDLVIYDKPKELSEFHHCYTGENIDRSGYPLGPRITAHHSLGAMLSKGEDNEQRKSDQSNGEDHLFKLRRGSVPTMRRL